MYLHTVKHTKPSKGYKKYLGIDCTPFQAAMKKTPQGGPSAMLSGAVFSKDPRMVEQVLRCIQDTLAEEEVRETG